MKWREEDLVEIIDCPPSAYSVAESRMKPFVRHTANQAQHGNLDLMKLATSAYFQGVYDAIAGSHGSRAAEKESGS